MYLMIKNSNKIKEFVLEKLLANKLINYDSVVIITGSASIEGARASPNYEKYFDGKSDIDVIIVVNNDYSFIDSLFQAEIVCLFEKDDINVLNYSYQYGCGRNAINIKYIKYHTFNAWMSFDRIHFKSYRMTSLVSKKAYMKCYGLDDYKVIPYTEVNCGNYYVLNYDVSLNGQYYLLDVHSMLLFGTVVKMDYLIESISIFNRTFKQLLIKTNTRVANLFSYYINDKNHIQVSELKGLIEKFTSSNLEEIIDIMKRKAIIEEVKGIIRENSKIATVCWARSAPKEVFTFMNNISRQITCNEFILLIDDICPKVIYERTFEEQEAINQQYRDKFKDCKIYFASDILKLEFEQNFVKDFFEMMRSISLNYYIKFLPQKKQDKLEELTLGELIHTFSEIFLIEYAEENLGIDTMIFGKFSQNVIFLIKEMVFKDSKLNYIIIPKVNLCEISSSFSRIDKKIQL